MTLYRPRAVLAAVLITALHPLCVRAQIATNLAFVEADEDRDGIPDNLGAFVEVEGLITSPNFVGFQGGTEYVEVYIQDNSDLAAVRLYFPNIDAAFDPSVLVTGKLVTILGDVGQTNGVTHLSTPIPSLDITVTTPPTPLPLISISATLAELLADPEGFEGNLVVVTNVTMNGSLPGRGASSNIPITDGTTNSTLRVDQDTHIDGQIAPDGAFTLRGIFTQFDTSPPFDSGYQIQPRYYSDLITTNAQTAPVLELSPPGPVSTAPGVEVAIDLYGRDINSQDALIFGLTAGSPGAVATFPERVGRFSWTPGAGLAGTTNTVGITLTDGTATVTNFLDVVVLTAELAAILLNEFLADPAADIQGDANGDGVRDAAQDEFVEIVNTSASNDMDISGWVLLNRDNPMFTFPAGTVLTAQTAVVVFGGGSPTGPFGGAQVFAPPSNWPGLGNSGGTIRLETASGIQVISETYGGEAAEDQSRNRDPDLAGTDFQDHSLVSGSGGRLFSPGTFVTGAPFPGSGLTNSPPVLEPLGDRAVRIGQTVSIDIAASDVDGDSITLSVSNAPPSAVFTDAGNGTGSLLYTGQVADAGMNFPITVTAGDGGGADTESFTLFVPSAQYSGVIINELLIDPDVGSFFIDANQDGVEDFEQDEFVEILNLTGAALDLAGCRLTFALATTHTFPSITVPDGGAVVIFGGGSLANFTAAPAQLASGGGLRLTNGGGTVSLYDPASNLLDRVTYADPGVPDGASLNRDPDVTGEVFGIHSLVSGSNGSPASPGTRANGTPFLTDVPPVISVSGTPSVRVGDPLTLIVSAAEPDGDLVTLTATDLPDNATFNATNGNGVAIGVLQFTPDMTQVGDVTATFTASDVDGSDIHTVTISVIEGTANLWDFETGMQGWTTVSLSSNRDWNRIAGAGAEGSGAFMSINGFTADAACDDWLISPPLDLNGFASPSLTFWIQRGFPGIEPNRQFLVSTNYTGGDPTLADWDVTILPDPGSSSWPPPPQSMSLTAYVGAEQVAAAFRYESDAPFTDQHNWAVDQIRLEETLDAPPMLLVPGAQTVLAGETVAFEINAIEPNGDLITLSHVNKPADAVFTDIGDGTGAFEWATTLADIGSVTVTFIAADKDGSDTNTVNITVLSPPTGDCGLIFSEYVEGSSNNKALELYNGTGAAIDLLAGEYIIQRFNNGSTSVSGSLALTNVLASGATLVIANPQAAPAVLAVADLTSDITFFNGNDALVLRSGGADGPVVDSFGRVGEDPGTVWGTEPITTAEHTLRRKPTVASGDPIIDDPFDPAAEWESYPQNEFSGLGAHDSNCPATGPLDTDGDGMPDDFEILYFGGATNGVAAIDEEGDGFTNLQEYIADTNPLDPDSYFRITVIEGGSTVEITFPSSADRVYQVEYKDALDDGAEWTPLAAPAPGTGGDATVIDPAAAPARNYRATVRLP